ncbi:MULTISPECIES: C45 family peptidase [unclassified Actinomyces]|uniref:C45 family autoproteolytic acyltransferase/hydolase n=1 Tax=unclassified Actinomyces TaxID=2609248 RepID=UPI00201799F7|nr:MULTISPECIES: C45 family peptidase [unclassified Actinomyces]MCL3778057.1 hypothetical protein [Actinomyces sp. AC-20-1]MCL3789857.1 hypothetical protein [Actinomyces sp. 187325]MCL3792012.1 hypothetical protein [Actinomyces sp. 186855]MCL3794714.1 hypothetical protein [Actinomyces sp. 217892]
MALPPIITVDEADPYERGRSIGQQAKTYIDRSLDLYARIFHHYALLDWPEVVEHAQDFRGVIKDYSPDILAEIDGIADGAGVGRGDILALNVRSEIMFGLKVDPAGECTSFFAGPSSTFDGHVLLGQNWDWKPDCLDTTIVMDIRQGPDAPAYITIVEAGLVAKTGFNSAGIGLTTNTLISPEDKGKPAVPYHVFLRAVLNCTSLDQVEKILTSSCRSASANYLVASSSGRGFSVETWPGSGSNVAHVTPSKGVIGHSNCFVCDVPFDDIGAIEIPDGPARVKELKAALEEASGSITVAALHRISQSHGDLFPNGICRHPDETQEPITRLATITSSIYDLTTLTAYICLGTPCRHDLAEYRSSFPEWAEGTR